MATLSLHRTHALGRAGARAVAEQVARALEARLGVRWSWEADAMVLSAGAGPARGTRGRVRVTPGELHVEIDLPLVLRAMRGPLEARITRRLDELLRDPANAALLATG